MVLTPRTTGVPACSVRRSGTCWLSVFWKKTAFSLLGPDFEAEFRKGSGAAAFDIAQIDDERRKPLPAALHVLAWSGQFRIEPVEMRPIFIGRVVLLDLQTFA